ncbi:type II toxin-antitoxin system Phd/YefM family antitoxin [Nocardioides sp. BYT-33-1]|jgi:prevent-host-death family protein|uniref:type II toxin-antitoxin system Phd/YefM family antitoxin n=1 Tax=Nocardioides sp. BYT-33-1 TaxID=3416952 RepID=UPI003F52FC9B
MKSITVAELRQNPTEALREVASGETYVVTRHRREVARLVPPVAGAELAPARVRAGSRLAERPRRRLRTAGSVEELLAAMESDR